MQILYAASAIDVRSHEKGGKIVAWKTITDLERRISFRIPDPTPGGQAVIEDRGERAGMRRIHVYSVDRFELYFDIVSYPDKYAHDEAYRAMKQGLSEQFRDLQISEPQATTRLGLPATEFEFAWEDKARRAVLVDASGGTCRIVYNPKSALNEQVLETLVFGAQEG
jgi:hypothetical protein